MVGEGAIVIPTSSLRLHQERKLNLYAPFAYPESSWHGMFSAVYVVPA